MRNTITEKVTWVHHWNNTLFSFKTTRHKSFTFESGQFVMIGLEIDGRSILRAYSIASPHYANELEFLSIKVPHGALTSKLEKIKVGEDITLTTRATGTLVVGYLNPGKHLYLLSTGTGLAPFMSIIQDPDIYDKFEKIILVHCVREVSELAYETDITQVFPQNEYFGDVISEKLIYYPSVTREDYSYNVLNSKQGTKAHNERITTLLTSGRLTQDLNLPLLCLKDDRFMLCGNNDMLQETMHILDDLGFTRANSRKQGDYVIEQAFIEK